MVRMKLERLRRGWNQVTESYKAAVPVSDISRFENGRALPYPAQRQRLARVLELDPATLLDDVDVSPDLEVKNVAPRRRDTTRARRRRGHKGMERDTSREVA